MFKKTALLLLMSLWLAVAYAADKRFTLVIDAGHGGHDTGALGATSKEKNINLNVALAFGRYVERNCPDVKVIYTRKTDVFVTLHGRANIANRNKADLFISIHTNALPKGKIARGLETYTLGMHRAADNLDVARRENSVILIEKDYKQHYEGFDPRSSESYIIFEFMQDKNMAQSVDLAKFVQQRGCAATGRQNKGVKQAGFLVLRETSMPSCLIELGFITTPDEERYLNSKDGIEAYGRAIYEAFMDYRRKYDKTVTVPYKPIKQDPPKQTVFPVEEPRKPKSKKEERKQKSGSEAIIEELANARKQPDVMPEMPKDDEGSPQPADTVPAPAQQTAQPVRETRKETAPEPDNRHEQAAQTATDADVPVFKVQILASSRNLRPGSQQFKGLKDVDCYEENGMYKFTYGASADYNEIARLRKSILDKFPEAFIIAFKGNNKVNVVEAINEFKQNRNKR